jgi:hypothetical protein
MLRRSPRLAVVLVAVALVGLQACEDVEPEAAEREAIEAVLENYLHALARAYSERDVSVLSDYATGSEMAAVQKLLRQLAGGGDRLEATLLQWDVERIEVFREVNATVRLTEVWDVGRFDAYSGVERGRNPQSVQSSLVQLRLMDGTWKVTARLVQGTEQGDSRWTVSTPTPAAIEGQD